MPAVSFRLEFTTIIYTFIGYKQLLDSVIKSKYILSNTSRIAILKAAPKLQKFQQ